MSYSKKIKVNFHIFEAADDNYCTNLQNSFDSILNSGETSGSFDSGETHFVWNINSTEDITDTPTFLVALIKERTQGVVWFTDNGNIGDVPLADGSLGELYYAFINPAKRFMITIGSATAFKKLLNEFSLDGGVKTIPVYENNVDKKVLLWDYYKKIGVSLNFPTHDDLAEFKTTRIGSKLRIIDDFGSLFIDFTLKSVKAKQVLDAAEVRDIIREMLDNDFCSRLLVRGGDFGTEVLEEYDLLNAKIKYTETVEIMGTFMSEAEAVGVFMRAFYEHAEELNANGEI